jgi:aspartokinase/homoserine dehydrogenase 1
LKGVSSIADTSLIRVKIEDTLDINNISSRVYNSLSKNGVSVILSSQKHTENEVAFAVRNNEETRSIELLNEEFVTELNSKEILSIEAKAEMSTVAIVGESITTIAGIEGRLLNTLGINGVNVEAYASGASKTYVAFIVASSAMKEALQIIHNTFLSKKN